MAHSHSVLHEDKVVLPLLWRTAESAVVVESSADAGDSLTGLEWRSTNGQSRSKESSDGGELHVEV
jgi:hypothetical protein